MNDRQQAGREGAAGVSAQARPRAASFPPSAPGGEPPRSGAGGPNGGKPRPAPAPWRRGGLLTVAALAAGLLGAVGFGTLHGAASSDPAPSAAELSQMQAEWAGLQASGLAVERLPAAQGAAAVQSLGLPPADADRLRADIQGGKTEMVFVTVWDDLAEDGDVVELSSDGVHRQVTLMHDPAKVALPMPHDGVVHVTGVRDGGGGGITVGVENGSARVRIPPMAPNQVLNLPVH